MRVRDKLGISEKTQAQLNRLMQFLLAIIIFIGLYEGKTGIIVNSLVGLLITFLPAYLERDYDLTMDSALVLWITTAVFLHAFGTLGFPGAESLYRTIPWWDHMTHMLSSSVVAAGGYSVLRALDKHYEELHFPRKFMFLFIFIFVISFGVVWELLEFGISGAAELIGTETVLTQYGLEDTMKDFLFNTAGGLLVALFGEVYLLDVIEQIEEKLEKRTNRL